ncbi:MAG: hypothetical protein IT361_08290 [Gemmatimonadaceae bacterium]|nr:hypothetical protein [Gemmatimonadaceae bacterium]
MRVVALRADANDREALAAYRWASEAGYLVREVVLEDCTHDDLAWADVLWCHAASRVPTLTDGNAASIAAWVGKGGHVVLTLLATSLAGQLGGRGPAPNLVEVSVPWRDADDPRWPDAFRDWPGYPHLRGFQGWGQHPLFTTLPGDGTYTWRAVDGERVSRAVYTRPHWPEARVIAVDRSYVHLDADIAVAWEFEIGGRITCLGANLAFASADTTLSGQRDALMRNALGDDAVDGSNTSRVGWPPAERRHAAVAPLPRPAAITVRCPSDAVPSRVGSSPPGDAPITLGAPRGLIVATAADGIGEAWLYPLCVLGDGMRLTGPGGPLVATWASVSDVHIERSLRDASGSRWHERAFVAPDAPELAWVLQPAAANAGPVTVVMRLPVRRQWPYAPTALVPLRREVRREGTQAVIVVTGCDGRHAVACHVDGVADVRVEDDNEVPVVRLTSLAHEGLRMVLRASTDGQRDLTLRTTDLDAALDARRAASTDITTRSTLLSSADAALDEAHARAIRRMASFMVHAPGGGRGLVAGYAASRPGWNRSRPGYAWFFGRDACWTVDALLAGGLHEEARDAIDLLVRTRDVTGKVIHELTASGVTHYDAADATPLFLRSVAAYAEWSGDESSVRAWWPAVRAGIAFVASCDRDGDGLPENTDVGHGWVEMGPLGGGVATSYVAAIWLDALRRLAPLARHLDDYALADRVDALRVAAANGLEALRLADGTLALHRDVVGRLFPDRTALAAVPLALVVGATSGDAALMHELAAARFSPPWGLRMLPDDDPRYAPDAYHAGSVWPLFTGWAALADCEVGEAARAVERVRGLATWASRDGAGGFAEVLHGESGARIGVCPDQAWSAAMVVSPIVSGVLRVRPDAWRRRLTVRARVPRSLLPVGLSSLRIGATRLDLHWSALGSAQQLKASHREGPPVVVALDDGVSAQTCGPTADAVWVLPDEAQG